MPCAAWCLAIIAIIAVHSHACGNKVMQLSTAGSRPAAQLHSVAIVQQLGARLYQLVAFGVQCEDTLELVLHHLHIDGAPQRVTLAEANAGLALRAPVRPGHMCVLSHQGC